jgi:hypothetical protein
MLIKLNDKGVRVYTSSRYRRLNPLDWQSRTGRVAKYSPAVRLRTYSGAGDDPLIAFQLT